MTKFIDGPAAGQVLMLHGQPRFLRVVCDKERRNWDALDQAGDVPRPDETIYCYELSKSLGMSHVKMNRGGGFYPISEYSACLNPPTEAVMRDKNQWLGWCARRINETKPIQ